MKNAQIEKEGSGATPPADSAVPGEDKGGEDKRPRAFTLNGKIKEKDERDKVLGRRGPGQGTHTAALARPAPSLKGRAADCNPPGGTTAARPPEGCCRQDAG